MTRLEVLADEFLLEDVHISTVKTLMQNAVSTLQQL